MKKIETNKDLIGLFARIIGYLVVAAMLIGFIYGMWTLARTLNYSFSYEDQVKQTVKDTYEKRISDLEKRLTLIEAK